MSYGDLLFGERVMDLCVEEEQRRAKGRRRARQVGQRRQGGMAWRGRWLLCNLGYRLVALGAWLEGYTLSRSTQS
ncbi:MAG: hypothetical protein PVG56_11235 [Anaerolineae bacterium]|jgi:hypothetical protein